MSPFNILPSSAQKDAVKPFTVHIPDSDLERTKTLLQLSNVADECYENAMPEGRSDLGLRREWLIEAKRVWETEFDWRATEAKINALPNFTAPVPISRSRSNEKINIHFIGIFSQNPAAVPIVFLHGWPGSILEFLPLFRLLLEKYPDLASLPYHLIAPSLPGFTLSDPWPKDQHYGMQDAAQVIDSLLTSVLGFPEYVAQGGDIGSRIGRCLASTYDSCTACLLNFSPLPAPEGFDFSTLSETEKMGVERGKWFMNHGSAYACEQATRPATLGFALSSSPLAILAWVGEKYLEWTDPRSFPLDSGKRYSRKLMEEAIASVAFYWYTKKIHTSFWSYREAFALNGQAPPSSNAQFPVRGPGKKFGFMWFPFEVNPVPKAWIEGYSEIRFWRSHEVGGHFAQLEQPGVVMGDLEDFVGSLRE
ncbi:putative hydrolase [Podospora australis]|uniref:Hydrolase n=1 Tax=Podospora australis TaxID=1536484 RepID=A0AAN6WRA5_9PEZI|nr:putative hydrolase [Podospora australis]